VNRKNTRRLLKFLAEKAARQSPPVDNTAIDLILLDDASITTVNEACFRQSTPTDVISCSYDAMPGMGDARAADIFVNVERAVAEGHARSDPSGKWSPGRELALYIAHGCDHLAGAEDRTAEERRRMRSRELRWLREAAQRGLSFDLVGMDGCR